MPFGIGLTLDLSYNGNGPAPVQVLDGLAYDPSVGGYLYAVVPAALSGFPYDLPGFCIVDGSGVIVSMTLVGTIVFNASGEQQPLTPPALEIANSDGSPGNTLLGVNAVQDAIVGDITNGGIWICTVGYDPTGPVDAVWVFLGSGATDLTFAADTVGPVLVDQSDGHTYRVVSTAGVLSTVEVT